MVVSCDHLWWEMVLLSWTVTEQATCFQLERERESIS